MKLRRETYLYTGIRLLICSLLLICCQSAHAQVNRNIFRSKLLHDTLTAIDNKEFLFNSATITNLTNEKISITLNIVPPPGWSTVSQKLIVLSLNAFENTIIPIRLKPTQSNTSDFQNVVLEYRVNNSAEPLIETFGVRIQAFTKFKAVLLNSNLVLPQYQKNISFPVFIRNMGNTPDVYTVAYSNDMLQMAEKVNIPLAAGKDTTFNITTRITEGQWSLLKKEDIKISVRAYNGETMNLTENIAKIGYSLKENHTAYLDMPLKLETGIMYQGEKNFQVYGGLVGSLDLSPDDRVTLNIKSNTYSPGQIINNNILRAEYEGKHVYGVAGNIMEVTDFFMDGLGAKLGYKWNEYDKVQVFSMLKSRVGNSKLFGIDFTNGLKENFRISTSATANLDSTKQLNSYVAKQSLELLFNNGKAKLNVIGGGGMEETSADLVNSANPRLWGTTYGYNLQWTTKKFSIISNVLNYSSSFPGIFKGQKTQIHEIRGFYKSAFIGPYYEYNFRKQNFFLDTALFSDVFNLETSNYGGRFGVTYKGNTFVLSAGRQTQLQNADITTPQRYLYDHLNLNLTLAFTEDLFFTTNSYAGHGSLDGMNSSKVFISSNQSSVQYKFLGVSARYDRGPFYYHEFLNYLKSPTNYQRLILSPYADFSFFRNALNIRSQLNYSKSTPNDLEISNLLANVSYNNPIRGFEVYMSGIMPLKQGNTNPYFSTSVRFRLHAPFLPIRKYFDLKLYLFRDKNSNGIQDAGEEPIAEQMVTINGNLFVTDERGAVVFKNIAQGRYKVDFGYGSKLRGWIPAGGTLQSFYITKNQTIHIPYKVSKVIQGKLSLTVDPNSNLSFSVANIKVSATTGTDSSVVYSTLTDANGEFYLNVPNGNYVVTLNEAAFDDNFRPTQFAQQADLINNDNKTLYFEVKQKRRQINIKKK